MLSMAALIDLGQETRLASRWLRKHPGFLFTAATSVGLGTGLATAVFAIANALISPGFSAVERKNELVVIRCERASGLGASISDSNTRDLLRSAPALTELTGFGSLSALQVLLPSLESVLVNGTVVQDTYFGTLGVRPIRGRIFNANGQGSEPSDSIVVSDTFWRRYLDSDDNVVGTPISVNGEMYHVVGVAAPTFRGTVATEQLDLWLPLGALGRLRHREVDISKRDRQASVIFELIGRLRPGLSPAIAEQQLRAGMRALVQAYPDENQLFKENIPTVYPGLGLPVVIRQSTNTSVRLLSAVAAVVLIIAIANVASMCLLRSGRRQSEFALYHALGASRFRLIRHEVLSGLWLAGAGWPLGLAFAAALRTTFTGQRLLALPASATIPFDYRVLAFSVFTSVAMTVLASALSALRLPTSEPWTSLTSAARGSSLPQGRLLGDAHIILQIGGALTLVICAHLLIRSVSTLRGASLGVDLNDTMVFGLDTAPQGVGAARRRQLDQRTLELLRTTSAIESVGLASALPLSVAFTYPISPESGSPLVAADGLEVSSDYFAALHVRLRSGRTFSQDEEVRQPGVSNVVILSQSAAAALFGAHEPLAQRIRARSATWDVIGVVDDVRLQGYRKAAGAAVYFPLGEALQSTRFIVIRSKLRLADATAIARQAVRNTGVAVPFFRAEPLRDAFGRSIAEEALFARLMTIASAITLLLAALGLYGLVSYSVSKQLRELGVRLALGATRRQIAWHVSRAVLRVSVIGCAVGLAVAWWATRVLSSKLHGITPGGAEGPFLALVVLVATVAVAAFPPVLRATRTDCLVVLKAE
jgi:predicted permease